MPDYELSLPKKKHALIQLNTHPKNNPNKDYDPSVDLSTPKTLFTPLSHLCKINLMQRIVKATVTEVETKKKAETAPWLRKSVFKESVRDENVRIRELENIKKPIDYNAFFMESFICVDEDIEGLTSYDFVPGEEDLMLLDFEERNFRVKEMKDFVMEYPSKIVIEKDGQEVEYGCNANSMNDYVLVEIKNDKAYYYPLKNTLKLKQKKVQSNTEEENL